MPGPPRRVSTTCHAPTGKRQDRAEELVSVRKSALGRRPNPHVPGRFALKFVPRAPQAEVQAEEKNDGGEEARRQEADASGEVGGSQDPQEKVSSRPGHSWAAAKSDQSATQSRFGARRTRKQRKEKKRNGKENQRQETAEVDEDRSCKAPHCPRPY